MFRNLRIVTRHLVIAAIAVIGMGAIGGIALTELYRHMLDERQEATRHNVQIVISLLSEIAREEAEGSATRGAAQARAIATVRGLRYGDGGYFWIFDSGMRMLMHPYRPDLEGEFVGNLRDASGKAFLQEAAELAGRDGSGFITYLWPTPGGTIPAPKLSYVVAFPTWGWIVASGIYMDDVHQIFRQETLVVAAATIGIILLAGSLAVGLSLGVTRPLDDIRRRMLRLAQGDRDIDVPHTDRDDEAGDLARAMEVFRLALIRMQRLREERERIREEGERALRLSEARLKELADLLPEMVFETDLQGKVTFANRKAYELSGYTPEDLERGFWAFGLIAPEDRERACKTALGSLAGTSQGPNEYMAIAKDGRRWPVMVKSNRIRRGDEVVGLRGIIVDISGLKKTEEQLRLASQEAELANRAKSEFLASMSHELRTPLNSIIGFSDILKSEMFGSLGQPQYREYAEDINESGRHLLALINDILDLSAIESGHFPLREARIDLRANLATCCRLVRERAKRAGVDLVQQVAADAPNLFADERRIRQIVLNLLSNAIKFTPPGGTVTLAARQDADGSCCLSVSDTGIGISPQDLSLVMMPFGRVSNPLTKSQEGSGLGLPLSRRLVEMHGGTLVITSAPEKGTTVEVRLPPSRAVALPAQEAASVGE